MDTHALNSPRLYSCLGVFYLSAKGERKKGGKLKKKDEISERAKRERRDGMKARTPVTLLRPTTRNDWYLPGRSLTPHYPPDNEH